MTGFADPFRWYGYGWRRRSRSARWATESGLLLRQTHIQIVATGTVGVAQQYWTVAVLGYSFQHHRHAGQRVLAPAGFSVALLLS